MKGIISRDKVCHVIARARQFDVKEADSDPASGSNASDDGMIDVLEDKRSDPTARELAAFINAMNVDERAALVALAWIGRGTYDKGEWDEALDLARNEHGARTAHYLLGLPLLGDYLEEALSAFGEDCTDFDLGRM
jgi:Xaa-Pro aminopeptidase